MDQKDTEKRKKPLYIASVIAMVVIILLAALYFGNASRGGLGRVMQHMSGDATSFSPAIIPVTNTEIANPMRGPQYSGATPPPDWPLADRYDRFCWSDIEKQEGQYDFSRIDEGIAQAKAAGYTFGWRIMPVNAGGDNGMSCLPQYLMDSMSKGFVYDQTYIPDYNDPIYIERARALIQALGQRYDNNPNVGLLDMSLYGCWGEWNESCSPPYPTSSGAEKVTYDNLKVLVDMQYQAFPHKRFLMLTDHQDIMNYALSYQRTLPTGVRIDCLGKDSLGGARKYLESNDLESNQWRVAPLYFEYCDNPDLSQALNDIKQYHASILGDGDGNIKNFDEYSQQDQQLLIESFKASGYRFVLNEMTLPKQLRAGSSFTVSTDWTNVNTAPVYHPWNVMIQLRASDGKVVWSGKSQLNLQEPFSKESKGDDIKTVDDSFTLPTSVAAGNYKVFIQIVDPEKVYAPLALANAGRQQDGSYELGAISVAR